MKIKHTSRKKRLAARGESTIGQYRSFRFAVGLLLLCLSVSGCLPSFPPVEWRRDPKIIGREYTTDYFEKRSFAIVDYSLFDASYHPELVLRDEIRHILIDQLEQKHYVFERDPEKADLIVSMEVLNEPRPVQLFDTIPSLPDHIHPLEESSIETFDSLPQWPLPASSSVWGNDEDCHPKIRILLYDRASRGAVNQVSGSSWYPNMKLPLALQYISAFAMDWIQTHPDSLWMGRYYGRGMVGMSPSTFTFDGKNFWPRIGSVIERTPAEAADFHAGDVILSMNGASFNNKYLIDILSMIKGDPGRLLDFKLWRYGVGVLQKKIVMGGRRD